MNTISNSALAWLLTYAIHSTVLLGLAWAVSRRAATSPAARDFLWKVALVGGIVTSTVQLQIGLRPMGSLTLSAGSANVVDDAAQLAREGKGAANRAANVAPDQAQSPSGETGAAGALSTASPLNPAPVSAASPAPDFAPANTTTSAQGINSGALAFSAWAILAFVLSIGYLARRLILVGRLGDRRAVTEGPLPGMLDALRTSSGHRGRVRLTASSTISSPVALGLGEICVPEAALIDLDADQQRGLLAHELAHLARRDPLWLDCASLVERVFFFQPLNRLARRELQRAAEYLCDDWAAARTGSGVPLAKCLARVAEWIQASPLGVPVAGMAEQRSLLVARIARLIEGRAARSPAPKLVLGGAAVVLLGVIVAAAPGVQGTAAVVQDTVGTPRWKTRMIGPAVGLPKVAGPLGNISKGTRPMGNMPKLAGPLMNMTRVGATLAGAPYFGRNDGQDTPADTAVVNALIERLKDTDAGVRKAAASSLGNLKSPHAVPGLIAVLGDRDHEVRAAAVEALGSIKDDRAIAPLSGLVSDAAPDVREAALEALSVFAKDVPAGPVIRALSDHRASVRQKAAELLGEIKDPAAAPSLTVALKDDQADVRHAALDALHELKVPVSERTLLDALVDPSPDVRQAAIQYVSDRPFAAAVPVLLRLLDDPVADLRVEAVSALGEIGEPSARDALRAALKSKDSRVRQRAAEVLGERR